jgi:hypothetical protein
MPFYHHYFLGLITLKSKEENEEKIQKNAQANRIKHPQDV